MKLSTTFHPQTDDQSERKIQILEHMLRVCVMDFQGLWNHYISLIEFEDNNSFQAMIGITPYELLYDRKYKSLVLWDEVGEQRYFGS